MAKATFVVLLKTGTIVKIDAESWKVDGSYFEFSTDGKEVARILENDATGIMSGPAVLDITRWPPPNSTAR